MLFFWGHRFCPNMMKLIQSVSNLHQSISIIRGSAYLADISQWMSDHHLKLNPDKKELFFLPAKFLLHVRSHHIYKHPGDDGWWHHSYQNSITVISGGSWISPLVVRTKIKGILCNFYSKNKSIHIHIYFAFPTLYQTL